MTLQKKINEMKEQSGQNIPEGIKAIMEKSAKKLKEQHIEDHALQEGDQIPSFKLKNALGEIVSSQALLAQGPLVINFYRGEWCPYCNLELQAYKEISSEIKKLGGQLVAISPATPDNSLSIKEKHALDFEILSDLDNKVAKAFGLVFKLDEQLLPIYNKMGIDLVESQNNENYELPMPATYVVDQTGKIKLAYANSDYTKRLEPKDTLKALKSLSSGE